MQKINSWKAHVLCNVVLSYARNCWEFEPVIKNSMGRETIYNADYFEV